MARKPSHRASDMPALEQEYLWNGRIPVGTMTIVAGVPSIGKSTLGYAIAASADVSTIFVTYEEAGRSVFRPKVEAAGMDLDKAYYHPEVRFSRDQEDFDHLVELIDQYGTRLIVVDPIQNHLSGASISQPDQVYRVFKPILNVLEEKGVALLLQMHVLSRVSDKTPPLAAVTVGVRGIARAAYLFGEDPRPGADPNFRALANAKWNLTGKPPASALFEFDSARIRVKNARTGKRKMAEIGRLLDRGETDVTAKQILVTLTPKKKETKADRVVIELLSLLREGPVSTSVLRPHFLENVHPPISWKTVDRTAADMEIERTPDPADNRYMIWSLYGETAEAAEEAEDLEEDIVIEEVDLPDIPDTIPEDWEEGAA